MALNMQCAGSKPMCKQYKNFAAPSAASALSSIYIKTPEEARPLRPSSPSDLDRVKMSEGKKEILHLDRSCRNLPPPPPPPPPPPNSSDSAKLTTHRYKTIIFILRMHQFLAQAINIECNTHNFGSMFGSFLGCMHPDYKQLLGQRDPCALLLFAYWYAKGCQCQLW